MDAFGRRALDLEYRIRECAQKAKKNQSYEYHHDVALAEFYVANRLSERTFLDDPKEFLRHLEEMKQEDFASSSNAFDKDTFTQILHQEVDALIEAQKRLLKPSPTK